MELNCHLFKATSDLYQGKMFYINKYLVLPAYYVHDFIHCSVYRENNMLSIVFIRNTWFSQKNLYDSIWHSTWHKAGP